MEELNVLLNNGEKYCGKYVSTRSFQDKRVVTSGDNPNSVLESAKALGVNDPVIFFVPEKDMVHIY